MNRPSSLPLLSFLCAAIFGLGGFFLGCLIFLGSTHGDPTTLVPTLVVIGALSTLPPLILGSVTVRSAIPRGKWMGWTAVVVGGLLAAFYALMLVLAATRKH